MVLLTKRGACPCSRKCMLARSHTHTTTPVCTLTLTHTLGEIEVTNEGSDDQSHEQALADENLSKFIGQESRYVHRYSCMHLYLQKDISASNVQLLYTPFALVPCRYEFFAKFRQLSKQEMTLGDADDASGKTFEMESWLTYRHCSVDPLPALFRAVLIQLLLVIVQWLDDEARTPRQSFLRALLRTGDKSVQIPLPALMRDSTTPKVLSLNGMGFGDQACTYLCMHTRSHVNHSNTRTNSRPHRSRKHVCDNACAYQKATPPSRIHQNHAHTTQVMIALIKVLPDLRQSPVWENLFFKH